MSDTETKTTQSIQPEKKTGRPTKKALAESRAGSRRKVGRPKGDAAIMKDYRARMIASPKSRKIMTEIMDAALNPEHKNQGVAWKLWAERVLPVSLFDPKQAKAQGGVNITITTAEGNSVNIGGGADDDVDGVYDDVIEGDYTDDDD